MRVWVETVDDKDGAEVPCRLHIDGRVIDIAEIVDRWYGEDYCYFKIKSGDGDLYILRLDEAQREWELTMFQSAHSLAVPQETLTAKRPARALTM